MHELERESEFMLSDCSLITLTFSFILRVLTAHYIIPLTPEPIQIIE